MDTLTNNSLTPYTFHIMDQRTQELHEPGSQIFEGVKYPGKSARTQSKPKRSRSLSAASEKRGKVVYCVPP
jgi:hypothetical protein